MKCGHGLYTHPSFLPSLPVPAMVSTTYAAKERSMEFSRVDLGFFVHAHSQEFMIISVFSLTFGGGSVLRISTGHQSAHAMVMLCVHIKDGVEKRKLNTEQMVHAMLSFTLSATKRLSPLPQQTPVGQ